MEYNKIIINNNLLHYSNKDNNFIPSGNISKNKQIYNNKDINTNQILKHNIYKQNSEINNMQNIINNNVPFSSRGNYRIKNDIYSFGNVEHKRMNKTPQARINKRTNFNYNEININNDNKEIYSDDHDFYDIRVDYCLQMLNLSNIKDIFHRKNIGFREMLYLSQNDMGKMGIPKYSQLIIQKFTKDYIEKASFYTSEELEKFFQLYYSNNIRKIIANKKIEGDFPIRSFSPIAYKNKSLLNKYDYNLISVNNFPNTNGKKINYNQYNKINDEININFNNNNHYINLNQRNCLSASQRRKNPVAKRKENINKNIRFSKSSTLYSNNKRIRNISSSDSQNYINFNEPIYRNQNASMNNYMANHKYQYGKNNSSDLNRVNKRHYSNQKKDINKKISEINKNVENYLNKIRHDKKRDGKFELLNLAINNFYKENMKKSNDKSNIQRKMNQKSTNNNNNYNGLLKNNQNNQENPENIHFNSYENINYSKDNYLNRMNNFGIQKNYNFNNNKEAAYSSKNKKQTNSDDTSSYYDNYFQNDNNFMINSKNMNKNIENRQHYKNSIINNYNNFINKKKRNKTQLKNYNNNERKIYNTSIIYKNNYNKEINKNSNNGKEYISFGGNSINLIKNNSRINNLNKKMSNNISQNNNQNLIINERNNLNIYYNANKLINNNIINYDPISSSSSEYFLNNQLIASPNKAKNKNNIIRNKNNKMKEIIKNINKNNIKKDKKVPLTNKNIKTKNSKINNLKSIRQINSKESYINNKNNINNFKSIPNKKRNNNFYKKFQKSNILNKKFNENIIKRSSSQINNHMEQIYFNKYINSDNNNINIRYQNKNEEPFSGRNAYIKNINDTEDSNYYINFL